MSNVHCCILLSVWMTSLFPCSNVGFIQRCAGETVASVSSTSLSPCSFARLCGGYVPKKSRKSKSKRKPLRLKYNIQKRVRAHIRKTRKQARKVEKEKIRKRKLGLIPEKLPVHAKDEMGWIFRSSQLPGTSKL
mmetsp:Transcript_7438/g.16952  ORF Transcript_7438/g.16952 Transcript_7438/m.16952 type:complete len:134 (-) Transcript_7438:3789-4190(-)